MKTTFFGDVRSAPLSSAIALALILFSTGCFVSRAAGRSFSTLFSTPKTVTKVKDPAAVRKDARLSVLWVGHATALVQIDDKFILTDPVFTSTVGELSKRIYEPGIEVEKLPPIDAVLISHMHFDHLSLGSLAMLEAKTRTLFVPKGGTAYITDFGFPIAELRRWQSWEKDGLRITATPVEHSGARYGFDAAWMDDSYTGYVIEYHGLKVWFGGDTAYEQKDFLETGAHFPGLDLALMPIGPTEPHDFMRHFHVDPREAVQAFFDLGAKRMVPIHYGTFINSTDEPGDALRQLEAAKRQWALGDREIVPLAIGEQRVFLKKGEDPGKKPPEKAEAEKTDAAPKTDGKSDGGEKEPPKADADKKNAPKNDGDKTTPSKTDPKAAPPKKDATKKDPPKKDAPGKKEPPKKDTPKKPSSTDSSVPQFYPPGSLDPSGSGLGR